MNVKQWWFVAMALSLAMPSIGLAQRPWINSTKRGVGMSLAPAAQEANLLKLEKLNTRWFYSWGAEPHSGFESLPAGLDFVPMAWGRGGLTGSPPTKVDTWIAGQQADLYDALLGFNEPDFASQANMSVTEALDLWPLLESTGLRLGSPATAHTNGAWMTQFMQGVEDRELRVDFVAVHRYGGSSPQSFLDYLEDVHNQYNRPIWITELGVADWGATSIEDNHFTDQEVYDFMSAILPALESLDYVERYAWFPAPRSRVPLTHSALFEDDGQLTRLGQLYKGESPGDFDGDSDVDGADFLQWQRGGSPSSLSGSDLADWEAMFGSTAQLSAASTAVPEPATIFLLAALGLGASVAWRRTS